MECTALQPDTKCVVVGDKKGHLCNSKMQVFCINIFILPVLRIFSFILGRLPHTIECDCKLRSRSTYTRQMHRYIVVVHAMCEY